MKSRLAETYPEDQWPADLRAAVARSRRWSRILFLWSVPYDAVVMLFGRQRAAPWSDEHYRDWSRHELIWRIQFLQGAGRHAWAEREAWRLVITPLAMVAAFALGLALAR